MKAWWMAFRFRHIVLELLVSLCLAFLVWLYIHSRARNSIDHVQIPVQVQLAPSLRDLYALDVQGQTRLGVSFSGPSARIRELRRNLQRGAVQVSVTLTVPEEKQNESTIFETVRINSSEVPVPAGVTAELAEEGASIPVTLHRLTERVLPVRLDYAGDVRMTQVQIEPPTVRVRGPKAILERAAFLHTQPYSLPVNQEHKHARDPVMRDQATLVNELEGRPITTVPSTVQFRAHVVPKQKTYDLHDVTVHFLCPVGFPYRPRLAGERYGKVSLCVSGPATDETPTVTAFVDLSGGNFARGRNLEPLRLQLPKDFQLAQPTTPLVAFYLDELERPEEPRQPAREPVPPVRLDVDPPWRFGTLRGSQRPLRD